MTDKNEDSILDFELLFLHNTANVLIPEKVTEQLDRCRKTVSLIKRRMIATDTVIRRFYDKKIEADQLEKALNELKEEYKHKCIENTKLEEDFTSKEQETQKLHHSLSELQEKYEHTQNVLAAMQSHANQLQNLVNQNQTKIESLTIENELQKSYANDCEKTSVTLKNENEELLRDMCLVKDVVFGKKKLSKHQKAILLKYNKNLESDQLGDQSSDHETDTEKDSPTPACTEKNMVDQIQTNVESLTKEIEQQKAYTKDCESKIINLKNENEELLRDMCLVKDVVFGKKKLNKRRKAVLQKYNKSLGCDIFGDQSSDHETDTEQDSNKNLADQNQTNIESLTIEIELQKAYANDCEKKNITLKNENAELLRDMRLVKDVVFGKKKLNKRRKAILLKYNKSLESVIFGDESSECETDSEQDLPNLGYSKKDTSPKERSEKNINTGECVHLNKQDENDSNGCKEVASADTGNGFSLDFLDGDKCFNSPDNFVNPSPVNTDISSSQRKNLVDAATNTIPLVELINVATSPVFEYENIRITLSPVCTEEMNDSIDMAVSPTELKDSDTTEVMETTNSKSFESNNESNIAHFEIPPDNTSEGNQFLAPITGCDPDSDICIDEETTSTSPVIISGNSLQVHSRRNSRKSLSERECLELNNSRNLDINNAGDCEIEMILQRMRLQTLLTPIPISPSKSTTATPTSSTVSRLTQERGNHIGKDVEKLNEVDKSLSANLTHYKQVIASIIDILSVNGMLENNRPNNNCGTVNTRLNNEIRLQPCVEDIVHTISNCESSIIDSNKEITTEITVINQSKNSSKESKELVSRTDFDKILPFSAQKSYTKNPCHAERNVINADHLTNIETNKKVTNKVKDNTKTVYDDKLEDMLPVSPIGTITKDPMHTEFSTSPAQNHSEEYVINTSTSNVKIPDEVDEDSLPLALSLRLEFERTDTLYERNTREEIGCMKSSCDKQNVIEERGVKNILKHRKLTKLEKLRNKLLPKSKIKSISTTPTKRLRMRPKQLPLLPKQFSLLPKQISANDNAASMNNKDVYAKAVEVMNEINSKEQSKKNNSPCKNKSPNKRINRERVNKLANKDGKEKVSDANKSNSPNTHKAANKEAIQLANHDLDGKEQILSIVNDTCQKELVIAVVKCDSNLNSLLSPSPTKHIATRSRSKFVEGINISPIKKTVSVRHDVIQNSNKNEETNKIKSELNEEKGSKKRPNHECVDNSDIPCKRMLRSSTLRKSKSDENSSPLHCNSLEINGQSESIIKAKRQLNYGDLDMFTSNKDIPAKQDPKENNKLIIPKESIFPKMVEKYGRQSRRKLKKLPDSVITATSKILQEEIAAISTLPLNNNKNEMNKLLNTILDWGYKQFMWGLRAYLNDPQRKVELFNTISYPLAPRTTVSEQILLYIISQLRDCWPLVNIVDCILRNIEYMLFALDGKTPHFDVIESMAHFYAVLCRYYDMKTRLRVFMMDAMYCIQFKAIPLIKQCLDVWMLVLPLAHMGIAKCPLVTCMVYLLHFYKCQDRLNRVQDIRNILKKKYFYEITEWNEPKILEMLKNAINEVRTITIKNKLLRMAFILIAKRHGPAWCLKNIIKKLLLPTIESNAPESVKIFSISLLGPLLKPFPRDMKVHCEIVMNELLQILKQEPSHAIREAVYTSMIVMHCNEKTVLQALLAWKPQRVTPELEKVLQDFVAEKTIKDWKKVLSKIPIE